jgi:hypothetical protein
VLPENEACLSLSLEWLFDFHMLQSMGIRKGLPSAINMLFARYRFLHDIPTPKVPADNYF